MEEKSLYNEIASVFRKWTYAQKRKRKLSQYYARRGTNFSSLKPRKGYRRVKTNSGNYVFKKISPKMAIVKKIVGRRLGTSSFLRKQR